MKLRFSVFIPVLLLLLIPVVLQILWHMYGLSFHDIRVLTDQVYIWVNAHYVTSIMAYEASMIVCVICAIPITALLTILAGFLFGAFEGAFWALLGSIIGNALLFMLLRHFFGGGFQKKYAPELTTFNKNISTYGVYYILLVHLLPFTPVFFVTLAAAFTKMSLTDFVWTCALGMLPGTLIHTLTGDQLHRVTTPGDLLSGRMILLVCIFLAMIVIAIWARKKQIHVPGLRKNNNKA